MFDLRTYLMNELSIIRSIPRSEESLPQTIVKEKVHFFTNKKPELV